MVSTKPIFVLVITLVLIACGSPTRAGIIAEFPNGQEIFLPECVDSTGLTVHYILAIPSILHKKGRKTAQAIRMVDGSAAAILLDKEEFPTHALPYQKFVLHHECAHHRLGHLVPGRPPITKYDELEADCEAARKLRKEGIRWNTLVPHLSTQFNEQSESHGSRSERIENMRKCYNG